MKVIIPAIAVLALASSCTPNELNDQKVLGCWTSMEEKKMECWERKGDTLYGVGLALQDMGAGVMDTVLWESFKLYSNTGVRQYETNVQGQDPVTFTETSPWVFENQEHDFPKRIEYQLTSDGDLAIAVGEEEEAFVWIFKKNQ